MFKLTNNQTFTHDVDVKWPVDGGYKVETFKATFRVLPVSEMEKFDLGTAEGTRDFLLRAVTGAEDVCDEQGKPVAWSDELRDQLLDIPFTRRALAATYFAGVSPVQPKK